MSRFGQAPMTYRAAYLRGSTPWVYGAGLIGPTWDLRVAYRLGRLSWFVKNCLPNNNDELGLVAMEDFPDPGAAMPVRLIQILGGPRWSLSIVLPRKVVKNP